MARTISLMQCPLRRKHPSHAHGSSAFQDGKLSSKAMFDKRRTQKKIQEDLPKYMNEHGFELERGD